MGHLYEIISKYFVTNTMQNFGPKMIKNDLQRRPSHKDSMEKYQISVTNIHHKKLKLNNLAQTKNYINIKTVSMISLFIGKIHVKV